MLNIFNIILHRMMRWLSGRSRRASKSRVDPYEAFYEQEKVLFQHTLVNRPWLKYEQQADRILSYDEVEVLDFDLRRYAHAIDKGLQLPEHKVGFGRDKIRCVLRMLKYIRQNAKGQEDLLTWCLDVLHRYHTILAKDLASGDLPADQRCECADWAAELSEVLQEFDDIEHWPSVEPDVNGLSRLFFERRSVRRWTPKLVDEKTLCYLVKAALWAPSSCNRQPHKFLFVRDEVKKKLLVELATGAKEFADCAPVILVLLNDVRAYYGPNERHLSYIDTSIAGQNLTLAAHELGLGTVWLNWAVDRPDAEEHLRVKLNIPPWYAVIALIAIGYPDDAVDFPPPARRPVEQSILFDSFDAANI
ncbi:MAG: nitroreductase family protein [Phycisphaerae bacterium]